jgi:hypothetical protein
MKPQLPLFAIASLGLALVPTALLAHHSFAAEYDQNKPVTVKGVVTKVAWVNPHIYTYVETKDENGKTVSWGFEGISPNALAIRGWKRNSLKPGDEVTITGYRAKDDRPLPDGSFHGNARTYTLADGRTVFAGSSDDGGPVK